MASHPSATPRRQCDCCKVPVSGKPDLKKLAEAVYTPDHSAVQAQITSRLLDDRAADVCDVTIRTLDNHPIPACRTILAIRSPYFKTLFFGGFREAGASTVQVALPTHLLKQVLEFAYSGRSSFVEALCAEKDHQKETLLDDAAKLVDLTAAADYCQLPDLNRWCNDVLKRLAKLFHFIVCAALEAMTTHASVHAFPCRQSLLDVVRRKTRECLLVPDCVVAEQGTPYQRLYKRRWDSHGVLKLSADSLDSVIQSLPEPHIQEYLFQALYYWATQGDLLPCAHAPEDEFREETNPCKEDDTKEPDQTSPVASKVDSTSKVDNTATAIESVSIGSPAASEKQQTGDDAQRWKRATEIARRLNYRAMRPVFLKDYVRRCGLVATDILVDVFCYHAAKGDKPIESLSDMPTV